jgi:hypothetical protein
MTGRRGRRREQLLDDLKEKRRYWKLKEEALDRILCRTRFGRDYGPVVRQTTEWMNELMNECVLRTSSNMSLSGCTNDKHRSLRNALYSILIETVWMAYTIIHHLVLILHRISMPVYESIVSYTSLSSPSSFPSVSSDSLALLSLQRVTSYTGRVFLRRVRVTIESDY